MFYRRSKFAAPTLFKAGTLFVLLALILSACAPATPVVQTVVVEQTVESRVVETAIVRETVQVEVEREVLITATPEPLTGELNVMGFSIPDEVASVRLDEFRRLYPGVELNIAEGGLDMQQFLTSVASGSPPDIIYVGRDTLGTYATRGAIVPLDDCINRMDIDLSQYREAALNQVTVTGSVYAIPEFFNLIVVLVNTAALEEAGLTLEDIDTSDWDALAEVNEQLTKFDENNQLIRIGFDPKLPEFLPLWTAANGGQLISDDGRTAMLDDPRTVEALEYAVSLHEVAGGRQPFMAFRDTWDFFGGQNQFVADQIGAFPMEQWYVNVLVDNSPDAPLAAVPFLTREGDPITYATGNSRAIPRGSKNVDAACAFMKTMTAPDTWAAAAQARADKRASEGKTFTGVYTGNKAADEIIFGEIMQPSGNETFEAAVDTVLSVADVAFALPPIPAGAEFRQAWMDAVSRALAGEQTPAAALAQAQQEAQEALDRAWNR